MASVLEIGDQPELAIYTDDNDRCEVWVNTGVMDHDGLCIGAGDNQQYALDDAIDALTYLLGAAIVQRELWRRAHEE